MTDLDHHHSEHEHEHAGMDHVAMHDVPFKEVTVPPQSLKIPPVLAPTVDGQGVAHYHLTAQMGATTIFPGTKTKSKGYNGSWLGPTLKLQKGEKVKIHLKNDLAEATTFHWHGLEIPSAGDGGPHHALQPQEETSIEFTVAQPSATLWYHPHPLGKTAQQVYEGLAGVMLIEDETIEKIGLPREYGVDDIPLVIQDRYFTADNQIDYPAVKNNDGTQGDTLVINGTVNPYFDFEGRYLRLRLLNGSNARNFTFQLSHQQAFYQLASDGGLLAQSVKLNQLFLTPGERAEILLDANQLHGDSVELFHEGQQVLRINLLRASQGAKNDINLAQPLAELAVLPTNLTELRMKEIQLFGMDTEVFINGKKFDPARIDLRQARGEFEIWRVYNKPDELGGMVHPFHLHGTQFRILSRDGQIPPLNEQGWKDTVAVNEGETIELLVTFEFTGVYMYHCHNLEHEDNGMMGQVQVD